MAIVDGTNFGLDEDSWVVAELEAIIKNYALDGVEIDIVVNNTFFDIFVDGEEAEYAEVVGDIVDNIERHLETKYDREHPMVVR